MQASNHQDQNTNTHERIQRLRNSARRLQTEIDNITREIRELETSINNKEEQETEQINDTREGSRRSKGNANQRTQLENKRAVSLEVGLKIQYNRKGGKRLNPYNPNNGQGTITKITQQWIYFRTDEGQTKYRAPQNVAPIENNNQISSKDDS